MKLVEKYLLNQLVSMYFIRQTPQIGKYSTQKEFRKFTKGWNMLLYGKKKMEYRNVLGDGYYNEHLLIDYLLIHI